MESELKGAGDVVRERMLRAERELVNENDICEGIWKIEFQATL